nr:hypothetical protein CFP56_04476 [Quercus suber]
MGMSQQGFGLSFHISYDVTTMPPRLTLAIERRQERACEAVIEVSGHVKFSERHRARRESGHNDRFLLGKAASQRCDT